MYRAKALPAGDKHAASTGEAQDGAAPMAVNPFGRERAAKSSQRKQHLGGSFRGKLAVIPQRRGREFQMEHRIRQGPWPGNECDPREVKRQV